MTRTQFDISDKPIKDFLDSVDQVLNSNTFLLSFDIADGNLMESLANFLKSNRFTTQIIHQDSARQWHNLQYFDNIENCYKVRPGKLVNEPFELKVSRPDVDKKEYLMAMLTGNTAVGRFFSFYSNKKERAEAETIIDHLIAYLTSDQDWNLLVVQPNFLKTFSEGSATEHEISYFNGDHGNDNAILIQSLNKGFLILTNGTP